MRELQARPSLAALLSGLAADAGARFDRWRFAPVRADYYAYLAGLLEAMQGRKTLLDHFEDDALRYGPATVRGRLAGRWARRYEQGGGDLAEAWQGTLPDDECMLVASAQRAGGGVLPEVLLDLAHAARLVRQVRDDLLMTTAAGLAAMVVALVLMAAVPFYTVPRLQQVFHEVPAEFTGRLARSLYAFADAVAAGLPFLLLAVPAALAAMAWALPRFVGRCRGWLDRRAGWRLYRDFHAIRFLAMLCVLLRRRGNIDTRLREALAALAWNARPWLAHHVAAMLARIDEGIVGPESLDTGLFDRELWWFLSDMALAHGLVGGLQQARLRIESHTAARVRRHAVGLRWGLLLAAVGAVLGLALWHYAAIDELRRALAHFHASR
ncbi:hypothetical protein [Bordetella sp. 2513F-2]